MKIHNAHLRFGLQFGLCLAACLPFSSRAGMVVPYWFYPEWIASRVMDFHKRNAEHIGIAQSKTKSNVNTINTSSNNEQNQRITNLAPVETATPKVNEKRLSKVELMELRKQLRQK